MTTCFSDTLSAAVNTGLVGPPLASGGGGYPSLVWEQVPSPSAGPRASLGEGQGGGAATGTACSPRVWVSRELCHSTLTHMYTHQALVQSAEDRDVVINLGLTRLAMHSITTQCC